MSVDQITSQDAFRLTLASPASVEGSEVVLTAENLVGPGVTPAAVQAAQDDATQALANSSVVWLTAYFDDITNDTGFVDIPPPVAGALTAFRVVSMRSPSADLTFTATIGAQVLANNVVTIAGGSAAGTIVAVSPTGTTTVAVTTPIRVTLTTGNVNAGGATILVGITRA